MRRTLAAAVALVAVSVAAQSPMYSDYPWGLLSSGVDQGPVWNLNCLSPGLLCTVDGGNGTASVNVAGGGGALSDAGFITYYDDPGLSRDRVLSAGNYTVADFGTAGQAQVDWQHGLTCSSGQALTTASTSTLQCTSTITASDLNCSGCVSDAELASNYSGVGACTNQFVRSVNDNAAPTCASVALGSDVSGILPEANGGTGTGALTCGTAQFLTSNGTAYSCSQGVNGSGTSGYATYWTGTYALSGESVYQYDATNNRLHVGAASGDTGSVNGYATTTYALVARNAITENGGGSIKALNSSTTGYAGLDLYDDGDTARQAAVAYGSRSHSVADKRNALYVDYLANANGFSVWGGSTLHSRFDATGLGVGTKPSYRLHVYDGAVVQQDELPTHTQYSYSSASALAGVVAFARSASATLGTNTIVASGNALGALAWQGANGTNYTNAASIVAAVDGAPGASNDMPGRLMFSTSADGSGTPTERMRIDSSGNVGIGVSPSHKLHVSDTSTGIVSSLVRNLSSGASAYAWARVGNDTGDDAGLLRNSSANTAYAGANSLNLYTGSAHPIGIVTNNTVRVTVDSSGNVDVASFGTPASETHVCSSTTGVLVLCSASDERKKEKVRELSGALRMVLQMRPVRYEWKDKHRMGKGAEVGFLAQDMMAVVPEVVGNNSDGTYLVHYDKLVAVLAGAIQELHADRTALAQRAQQAEDRLAQLEARLSSLEAWSGMAGCPPDCQPKP